MQANMGMAGEFRCVVKRADGSTKIDTGYQKNLILNQGLDFFGGGNGSNIMQHCVIGSGNSQPVYTQNKLDTAITGVSGATFSTKYDYDASRDGNLYKTNRVCKYSFTELNNVNVSELGLASTYSNATTYFLCTRALIKDSQGNPTTITVLSGEVLEIYYKLWAVYDTTDKNGAINLLDGTGNSVAYNYALRPSVVGSQVYVSDYCFGMPLTYIDGRYSATQVGVYTNELQSINSNPSGLIAYADNYPELSAYSKGSYKKTITFNYGISNANGKIRALQASSSMGIFQIRFGSVADDSPITKTNTQTLSIPIEFSWGRYEGAL